MVGLVGGLGFVLLGGLIGWLTGYREGWSRGQRYHTRQRIGWRAWVVGVAVFTYALVLVGMAAHAQDNHRRADTCLLLEYDAAVRYVDAVNALDREQTAAIEKFYVSRGPGVRGKLVMALRDIEQRRSHLPHLPPCAG